jgi:hypothetical protein
MDDKEKKYDTKKYYETYKKKKDLNEKIKCDLCGGSYSFSNKTHHIQTKKHQFAELIKEKKERESICIEKK